MKTANIVHPNDPRGNGSPLTIIVKKLSIIEAGIRQEELAGELRPYEVPNSADAAGRKRVEWRLPSDSKDVMSDVFWMNNLRSIAHGWLNPPEMEDGRPAEFNKDNLWLLFDKKYSVKDYTVRVGDEDLVLAEMPFPFFVVTEFGKPGTFGNPPQSGSGTP